MESINQNKKKHMKIKTTMIYPCTLTRMAKNEQYKKYIK